MNLLSLLSTAGMLVVGVTLVGIFAALIAGTLATIRREW